MTKLGEELGVSGSYLTRVCANMNVPRPGLGYWAKLAVGKAPSPTPLPEAQPGDPLNWSSDGELQPAPRPRKPAKRSPKTKVRISTTRVHWLVSGAKLHFEKGRPVKDDAYLRPYKKLLLDVTASKACLDKALSFANDLYNALESVGYRVVISPHSEQFCRASIDEHEEPSKKTSHYHYGLWSPQRPTVVYIGSVAIGLAIIEMSENVLVRYVRGKYIREADYIPPKNSRHYVDHTWTTTKDLPCGRLRLVAYCPYGRVDWSTTWDETKRSSLNSSLKAIVSAIEDAASDLVPKLEEAERQAEIAHQRWLEDQERRRKAEDRRQVEKSIRDSQEHLGKIIQQWSSVVGIERFFAGVEQRISELPVDAQGPLKERLELAREFMGSQDPLDFFRSWETPIERYSPKYPQGGDEADSGEHDDDEW